MGFAGFCIGGVDWPRPELLGVEDPAERSRVRRETVRAEARMTHALGGNLLRIFFDAAGLVRQTRPEIELVLGSLAASDPDEKYPRSGIGLHRVPVAGRVEQLTKCDAALDLLVAAESAGDGGLDFSLVDDVVGGVTDANHEIGDPEAVRVLLSLVAPAPRWIIESPSAAALQHFGVAFSFASLWERYLTFHELLHRRLVHRYVADVAAQGGRPAVVAFEIGNEPDYVWTPEEVKIEGADPLLYPLFKYVTELQLPQVPERPEPAPPFEPTPWGFQAEDGEWATGKDSEPTPVIHFDWGPKFDWYVKCFAEFQERIAGAVQAEAAAGGVHVDVVSGSVTHNNLDYLLRLHRANPRAFESITKIGIHPYHWVRNDVWDNRFVDAGPMTGWTRVSPREYAGSYFKRFDFLEELARCVAGRGSRRGLDRDLRDFSKAVAGRKIWITEFGVGTKVLGAFNAPIADYTKFIRPRREVGLAGGRPAVIWEDLWEAFLDQAGPDYLARNEVDGLLLYSLREIGGAGLDMDDDDRSNLAVLRRDGSSRMDETTLARLSGLLSAVAGRGAPPEAPPTRATASLHHRPWRAVSLPQHVLDAKTMLSTEERQLLYWLTETHWRGEGAIVDGGCFLGGSTLALAEGLRANPAADGEARIDVFDLFEVEPYMTDLYFEEAQLAPGDSFRPIFDEATAGVAASLDVHEGDLTAIGWDGRPIEVLFVDIAKSWSLNDVVVDRFFPCLIPGRSVVVQQDYAFAFQPWVAITMEYLSDYFEAVAFAEYNSVVFVCTREVPRGLVPGSLAELPGDTKMELFDRATKHFLGYPRGYLEVGRAALLADLGDPHAALTHLSAVQHAYRDDGLVLQAAALVNGMLEEAFPGERVSGRSAAGAQATEVGESPPSAAP